LKIKASAYGVPLLVSSELEGGVIGCAALAAAAEGRFNSPVQAA
jgi:xylulokinase